MIVKLKTRIREQLRPTYEKMQAIGGVALSQIHARFDTSGGSGGATWKAGVTPLAQIPSLSGLRKTFKVRPQDNSVSIASDHPFAAVHQVGMIIVPKKSPRLFIPLTEKARQDYVSRGESPPTVSRVFAGSATLEKPDRDKTGRVGSRSNLVYGVDYVLAKQSVIPPRPMLPDSDAERGALAKAAICILGRPSKPNVLAAALDELANIFGIEFDTAA